MLALSLGACAVGPDYVRPRLNCRSAGARRRADRRRRSPPNGGATSAIPPSTRWSSSPSPAISMSPRPRPASARRARRASRRSAHCSHRSTPVLPPRARAPRSSPVTASAPASTRVRLPPWRRWRGPRRRHRGHWRLDDRMFAPDQVAEPLVGAEPVTSFRCWASTPMARRRAGCRPFAAARSEMLRRGF